MASNPSTSSVKKYQPKFARVLIRREVKKQIGSIILPGDSQKRHASCEGVIVALGETAGITESYDTDSNSVVLRTLKVGDRVIFGRYSGTWLDATYTGKGEDADDGTLFICQDQDILAVIEE